MQVAGGGGGGGILQDSALRGGVVPVDEHTNICSGTGINNNNGNNGK